MANTSFGLDIGLKSIKVVMLNRDHNKLLLRSCLSTAMPGVGMTSESSFDIEEIAQTIRKLVNDAGINVNNVHTALPDSTVFTKVIEIPDIPAKDIPNAIYWEAEQNIPAPLSTITLSWRILQKKKTDADNLLSILLVGAPTNMVRKYQNVLEMAGLNPITLETEILAVVRSLGFSTTSPATLVVNVGSFMTTLAIVQAGILVFTYSVPLGDVAINRAISTDFGFSEQQAEEYKRVYGIADQQVGGKIATAIQPILQSMTGEIRKALAYYIEKYPSASGITQIVLSGPTARLPGIDLYFVQNLGIETVIANPWKMLGVQNVSQGVLDTKTDYATAVGLALNDYE